MIVFKKIWLILAHLEKGEMKRDKGGEGNKRRDEQKNAKMGKEEEDKEKEWKGGEKGNECRRERKTAQD